MKKKFIETGIIRKAWIACSIMCACMFGLSSCWDDYDNSELRGDIENLKNRIKTLEEWQKSVNTDIQSLQSLVEALEDKDYVTAVTPLDDGTGYVISFLKSGNVTIKHGEKGENGTTPVISVKQDTDGKCYWTLNGEWLLDNGNKIPVTGEKGDKGDKGEDAITPQVRINTDTNEWEISTDNGTTWVSTGVKATGEKGDTGAQGDKGDSMFSNIDNSNEAYVELTLADGVTKIKLPRYAAFSIAFESDEVFYASPSDNELTLVLPATLKESDYRSIIATVTATNGADVQARSSESRWSVTVTKPTFGTDGVLVEGSAKVTIKGTENTRLADTYLLRVALVAANGTEVTASRLIKYFDGTVVESQSDITDNTVKRLAWKGDMAEDDFAYIRNNMASTLEVLDLSATTLTELPYRALAFYSSMGLSDNTTLREVILPEGLKTIHNCAFAMCKALNKLNVPSTVTTLGGWILEGTPLTSFTIPDGLTSLYQSTFFDSDIVEIRIPTTVKEIPGWCFQLCENLERIYLHDGITSIGQGAFSSCPSLDHITIPKGVTVLSKDLFASCHGLREVYLHDGITAMDEGVFYCCTSLTYCTFPDYGQNILPDGLTEIGKNCFYNTALKQINMSRTQIKDIPDWAFYTCENLKEVAFPYDLETIGNYAFSGCPFTSIALPASLTEIKSWAFGSCNNLRFVECRATTPPTLNYGAFPANQMSSLTVPTAYIDTYKNSSWNDYFESIQ
mgnify:FL=1